MCQLRQHNLLSDEYPDGFDLILCRNVVKFFEDGARFQVQNRLASSLNNGGFLVVSDDLGRERIPDSESIGLTQIDNTCIYRKIKGS